MNRTHIAAVTIGYLGSVFCTCQIAKADTAFDECVMGQMQGQNIYMLPMAQSICRKLLPPPPVEIALTQEISYNVCSSVGEELAICISNPPRNKYITRVVGYFANRSPCTIPEDTGPFPATPMRVGGPGSPFRKITFTNDDVFVVVDGKSIFTGKYCIEVDPAKYDCYSVQILGYENCSSDWFGDPTCR